MEKPLSKYKISEKQKIDVEVKTQKITVTHLTTVEKKCHKDIVISFVVE